MSYSEIYTRINWKDDPDTSTPLDAYNLNLMDMALKAFDIIIKTIGNDAMYAADVADCLYGQPSIDQNTGIISFPKKGGGAYTLDTLLEKVIVNFDWDEDTQILTITLQDGSTKQVDLSALIQENEFIDSSTVVWTVTGHKVQAGIKAHSIGPNELQQDYLADCENAVEHAEDAASDATDRAEDSEAWAVGKRAGTDVPSTDPTYHNNSKYYSEQANALGQVQAQNAESWAVGQRGGTDVPSTDPAYHNNSKYYSEQANSLGQAQAQNAEAWASGTRGGVPVPSTDPAYHNNAKYWEEQAQAVVSNTFAGLNDVEIEDPSDGQAPLYDAATGKWKNGNVRVDISGKADKVANATNGHLASLNAEGNLVDSGLGPDDVGKAYIASNTAPSNTKCFWIDTAHGGIQKRYDGTSWVIVPAAWA